MEVTTAMYFKLAVKNVRKSVKDFTIYFLTLTFGVCLFYVFNSVESQQSMLEISESQHKMLQSMTLLLGYVSVFITFVLGFLIIYANNFLIRRRKKELGLYMTLGMDRGKISRILIGETFVIGVFALAVGLLCGVFAAQGLSVVTAQLLHVNMKRFQFVFSPAALWKSVFYFGVIFLVVMVFNTVTVSRYQLIDLLYGGRRNESLRVKRLWLSMLLFLLAAACLGGAYYWVVKAGFLNVNGYMIFLGCAGTLLFFVSLSGFLLRLVKTCKGVYYKGLNMFILRQINSKITTNSISMSVICLMLFVALCTLSCGAGLGNVMSADLNSVTPYDASVVYRDFGQGVTLPDASISAQMAEDGIELAQYAADYAEYTVYESTDAFFKDLITPGNEEAAYEAMGGEEGMMRNGNTPLVLIGASEYNRQMELQGREPVLLGENQFAVNANYQQMVEVIESFLQTGQPLAIQGKQLFPLQDTVLDAALYTTGQKVDAGTVVVPDEIAAQAKRSGMVLNLQYAGEKEQTEERFQQAVKQFTGQGYIYTKIDTFEQGAGVKTVIYYIALYVGIVFLLTCSAVLALQQLSESSDNVERYALLQKIGAEQRMVNRAMFWQIFIYFMVPLALALVHSYFGIKVSNEAIQLYGNMDVTQNILFAATIILLIYGGYFVATYLGSKNMITSKKN